MQKTRAAANVIDLEAYRQRKMRAEQPSEPMPVMSAAVATPQMVVPYFFCWVPMWPVLG